MKKASKFSVTDLTGVKSVTLYSDMFSLTGFSTLLSQFVCCRPLSIRSATLKEQMNPWLREQLVSNIYPL
jgi:hypothetical protein